MRLLEWFGPDRHSAVLKVLAFPSEGVRLSPGAYDERDRFPQPAPGFARIDIVGEIFMRNAAHEARDEPPAAHDVEHGVFLGDADRVEHGHEVPDHGKACLLGALDQRSANQVAVRHQSVRTEMMLVATQPVEAVLFGACHAIEIALVELLRGDRVEGARVGRPGQRLVAAGPGHSMKKTELHRPAFSLGRLWR
jgi:hypothetical protein